MNPRTLKCLRPVLAAARRTEEIARDVARAQSEICSNQKLAHALREQSKQEAAHADAFDRALRVLGEGPAPKSMLDALDELGDRLHSDVKAGELAASMVGLQYVLEGLGSVALSPPAGEFASVGDRYVPLRDLVLHQEIAHRRLGEVWIPRLAVDLDLRRRARLTDAADAYAGLASVIVEAGLPLLEELGADRAHYARASRDFIESLVRDPLLVPATPELTA